MENKLQAEVRRRQNQALLFYHSAIGNKLKKRRIELQMTQQALAKGIISNTFVSKLENNVIHANKECLLLLMERLELPLDVVDLPESLLEYLDRSVEYYYWLDVDQYRSLIQETSSSDFSILVQIVRLGYAGLVREEETAISLFNDLCRYFTSMDDSAFSIFMIYGAEAHLLTGDLPMARQCLDAAEKIVGSDRRLVALIRYQYSLLYGYTEDWGSAFREAEEARRLFEEAGNLRRIMKMNVDRFQFRLSDHFEWTIPYSPDQLNHLVPYDADRYHFLRAILEPEHEELFQKIPSTSRWYPPALFFRCRKAWETGDKELFSALMCEWDRMDPSKIPDVDFRHLLNLWTNADPLELKDYLIDHVLPLAVHRNNLLMMRHATEVIVQILTKKKRYKDACLYTGRLARETERIKMKRN